MTRRISTKTPNAVVSEPATVTACQQDRGTAADRAVAADAALGQSETAKFKAKANAEAAGGRR